MTGSLSSKLTPSTIATLLFRLRETHPHLDTQGLTYKCCIEIAMYLTSVGDEEIIQAREFWGKEADGRC